MPIFSAAAAQDPRPATPRSPVTLAEALSAVLRSSPDIVAAREAASAARGRERQAGARLNPALSYNREQVGSGSDGSSEDILEIEQPLEIAGPRAARTEAARFRREAADARVRAVEVQVAYEVAVAFAGALAGERRAVLASQLAEAFSEAERVGARRLAGGDISGFAARRIRLEATRYSVQKSEALLANRTARLSLLALMPPDIDGTRPLEFTPASIRGSIERAGADSLALIALRRRSDLVALSLEGRAAVADAAAARRERNPIPIIAAGAKREANRDGTSGNGFVAGLRVPLALWDRRGGSIDASDADVRRMAAELAAAERKVRREVAEAADALRTAGEQLDVLTPQVSSDAAATLRSAQVAYTEGEISLLEWLDAARAYHEVETSLATLRSEYLVRAAVLHRAVGGTLMEGTR